MITPNLKNVYEIALICQFILIIVLVTINYKLSKFILNIERG